ncbi:MAG: ATP-dependent DNA helicase [Candidatus Omnitrophota bacterium]
MNNFNKYYDKLNSKQREAVDRLDGPLLILAGPGTGKTELLSVRAANIIRLKKAAAENILILTYTNAAAKAMKERLVRMLGPLAYDVEVGTFHSFANSVILESEEAADYIQEKALMTDIEEIKLLEYILDHTDGIDAIRPLKSPYHYRRAISDKISELKRDGVTPKEFGELSAAAKPDGVYIDDKGVSKLNALAVVYKLYEEYKRGRNKEIFDERGRYDLDDMIVFALEALRNEPELKRALRGRFSYIMVDEYQDTNGAQMNLLFELIGDVPFGDTPQHAAINKSGVPPNGTSPNSNLCCVGDDDQSIYRFQGASVGNFRTLRTKFPSLKEISLERNYRSTPEIVGLTDKIIKFLPERERLVVKELVNEKDFKAKKIEFREFTTDAEELLFITEKIKEMKSGIENSSELSSEERRLPYNQIAVLVRKRKDILRLIDAFLRAGIPYATDGKEDISSEKRVKQMLDVLHFAHMKDTGDLPAKDALFYRIITSDYLGIPLREVLKFIERVNSKRRNRRANKESGDIALFSEFLSAFGEEEKPAEGRAEKTVDGAIEAMRNAARAIKNLLDEAEVKPVHAILMRYIKDAGVFRHILESYADKDLLRIRDLRALSSFVNMVKDADLSNPAVTLAEFIDELQTKKDHNIPLTGDLVTMTQEGVRIFTAHGSKGLEFHSVVIPFCLQDKNWPAKPVADLIPLPAEFFKGRQRVSDKKLLRTLDLCDETRLFYVASTRAKANLIYTASPTESAISSSYIANAGLERAKEKLRTEEETLSVFLKDNAGDDPLIGAEAVLKDMVSNLSLNPTSLNNYITCKRRYLYNDVFKLPSEKNLSLTFGSCVHKALEDTYMYFMRDAVFPDFEFFKDAFKRELYLIGVEKSIQLGCLRQMDNLKKWFDKESRSPIMPLGLEKKLTVMIEDDLVFNGKYDKTEIVSRTDNTVRVVDYKTGKPDDHIKSIHNSLSGAVNLGSDECDGYLRQLVAYKLLFDRHERESKGYKVSHGVLVFIEPAKSTVAKYNLKEGEYINKIVELNNDMVSEIELVIKDCRRGIKNLEFDKLPEFDPAPKKCGNCGYKDICWP